MCPYLQGLQALQKGLGFVLLCQAGVRVGAWPAVWLRLGLFGTVVLLLHFGGQFILTHNKTRS